MTPVESQYNNWVYPAPIEDMFSAITSGSYWEIGDPLLYQNLLWPNRRNIDHLDILVAGCGSAQAAYYACRNPNWKITGIDISESSLAHQKKLKERHNLSNLRLEKLNLTEIGRLGSDFDFIVSTGVLHHLENPKEGLTALRDVLRRDGLMNLMVYGKSLRVGVYMLQEVFKQLNFQQTQEDVDIVKATVHSLPEDHALNRYLNGSNDLHYDAGYVDTFLHPQDRAFDVPDIYELTRSAGLEFFTWCDPFEYSLDAAIPPSHALWKKLGNLSPELEAHVCDLLTQTRGTHRWIAAHPDQVQINKIPFDSDELFDCAVIIHRSARLIRKADHSLNTNAIYERRNSTFEVSAYVDDMVSGMNCGRSIRESLGLLDIQNKNLADLLHEIRIEVHSLWRQGHLHILLANAK